MLQANKCLTSCSESPQSVQMSLGSPYACSPAADDSVQIVALREYIVASVVVMGLSSSAENWHEAKNA